MVWFLLLNRVESFKTNPPPTHHAQTPFTDLYICNNSVKKHLYTTITMPSASYQKNKQYALVYNAKNADKIRELNRINKHKYDVIRREFKRLSSILLIDI